MKFIELWVEALNRVAHPYRVPLATPGIVLVEGENRDAPGAASSNGAGKSWAVTEALLYSLFGRMARHGGKPVTDEAAHPINGADVSVTIELRPGYVVHVRRTRAPRGHPVFTVTTPEGRPVPLSKDLTRRAEDVATLLGLDYVAFRAAVVMTRGEALAGAGFSTQMSVLEGVLRLDELNDAAALSAKRALALEKSLASAQADVMACQRVADEATKFLIDLNAAATYDYAGAIAEGRRQLKEAVQAGEQAAAMDLAPARAAVDGAQSALTAAAGTVAALQRERDNVARHPVITVCPTCNRPFKNAKELETQQRAAQVRLEDLNVQLTRAQAAIPPATGKLHAARAALQGLETTYWHLSTAAKQEGALKAQIDHLEAQQQQQAQQRALAEQRVREASEAFIEAEASLIRVTAEYGRKTFWAKEFGRDGLQAQVFAEALPVLNRAARDYGRRLTGGLIEVAFNPLRESRAEDLIRVSGASAPTYDGLSDGEKERINIVIAFSLRALARWRLPEPVNLLILDEVVSSVDPAGTAVVLSLLDEEVRAGVTVFVISHDPEQRKLFPAARLLRVVRENGEATVAYAA